ncbi:MAG TPA: tetratricopeptide repeat protein [Pyrinomonadaceae bacterium]|nr:tetratricopeptide repeat protein [Pyrinomonadaceae bacterium]
MAKPCPGCGAATVPEARFCRLCGAPLKTGGGLGADGPVSPLAQTIPLTGEGRATDGLNTDDARRAASDTSRVGRAEMESILRRAASAHNEAMGDGVGEKAQTPLPPPLTISAEQATAYAPAIATAQAVNSIPAAEAASPAADVPAQHSTNVRSRRLWQVAAIALLCVALVAGILAFVLSRRASSTEMEGSTAPISISDQKQLVSEKLSEADVLLASGEFNRAITVLRSAVKLDPSNVEARLRLGDALEKTGARTEAIDEYRAATVSSPANVEAWRALASAQFAEKLYAESAESYRRLIEASGEKELDDETRLAFADALRLSGRSEEARNAYRKIDASAHAEVARAAREHLVELGPAAASSPGTERAREDNQAGRQANASEVTTPSPTPTVAHVTPSPAVITGAQADADGYYFKAMNIVNGRDPKKLSDGELTAALNYFLRAQGGAHGLEASRYAERLGREYDRRRKR